MPDSIAGTGQVVVGVYDAAAAYDSVWFFKEFREMKTQPSLERALRHKEILKA